MNQLLPAPSYRPSAPANESRIRLVASDRSLSTMHSISRSGLKLGGTTLVLVMVSSSSHRKAVYYVQGRENASSEHSNGENSTEAVKDSSESTPY